MNRYLRIRKMADAETALPGFSKLWKAIKAELGTTQRGPKGMTFSDQPSQMVLHDFECGRRWALDLRTMELGRPLSVSGAESACHAGSNNDQSIDEIPDGCAVLEVTWNDYYRSLHVKVVVRPGALGAGDLPEERRSA